MQGGCPGFESQWVHASTRSEPRPLSGSRWYDRVRPNRCTTPCERGWEGSIHAPATPGMWMRPCVRAIQASTGPVQRVHGFCRRPWLLCQLVDSSARVPTKDVPSCDKPEGAARRRRTRDFRMRISIAIALRNGERPELKHLSTDRKRNRTGCRQ